METPEQHGLPRRPEYNISSHGYNTPEEEDDEFWVFEYKILYIIPIFSKNRVNQKTKDSVIEVKIAEPVKIWNLEYSNIQKN